MPDDNYDDEERNREMQEDDSAVSINEAWSARHLRSIIPSRTVKYDTPEQLAAAVMEYFQWNAENPLYEERVNVFKGDITRYRVQRVRAMSVRALALYIGVASRTWRDWAHTARMDLKPVVDWAEDVIYQQKFEAASADLINASIAIRDLGLADKQEVTSPDGSMTPVVQYQLPDNGRG